MSNCIGTMPTDTAIPPTSRCTYSTVPLLTVRYLPVLVLGMRRLQYRMNTRTNTRTSTDLQYKQYEYAHNIDDDESRRRRHRARPRESQRSRQFTAQFTTTKGCYDVVRLLPAACCLLPTVRVLPTAYCLLPIAYIAYSTAHIAYCLYCLLPTAYCLLLPTACCLLHIMHRLLPDATMPASVLYLLPTTYSLDATSTYTTSAQEYSYEHQTSRTNPPPRPNVAMLGRVPPKGLISISCEV